MSNPFLFNSFGGAPPQQQNYPNNQQNQGWNQNTTATTQSNFQSPQMDFFDITTPQFNQTPPNNNTNGPKDFRSLMNSTSNDTTSQFSQPFQPPQDLNQLRSIFTRDDDPIIVPVTPQTNQQQQQPYSTSTYSPSFTFIPENMNQNQSTFTQPEKQQQTGQMTVDFSKYDPLAGEIGKTNVSKQPASNENNQVTSQIPDVDNVPMVFYGADTTSTNAPTDFGGGFSSFQSNPSAGNANQTQPQNNFFNIQQPNQSANNFNQQNQQQQQNSNFFNMQAAPQQSQAQSIFNNEQTQQQQTQQQAAPIQQNADFFTIQPDQQSTPATATTFSGAQNQQQAQQTAPIQQNADFFTIQPDQQSTPATTTTTFSGAQNQQQAQQTAPVQQNTDFFTFHPDQQSTPATTTTAFSGAQNQQQASADIFTMPNTQQTNENPFLMPQKPQSNSTDISRPFQMIENSIPSPIYANGSISHSNPSLSVFDMFRVDNNQQQQQNSHLVTNIPDAENQQNSSMDHIFGDATQQQQQNSNPVTNLPVTENQQNSSMDHIFGDMNQSNQQQPQQSQQQNSNPITNLPAADNQQNSSMDHIFGDMNQSAQQQQQPDIFDPFGRNKNASQQEQQKPTVSSGNPFVIDNGFKIEINAPKSEPIFATVDDAYNPFGESTNDKENPFAISNNAEKENVYQAPSFLGTSNTDNQPQNVNDSPSKLPEPSQNEQNDNPFVGITTTGTNPFISDQAKSQEKQVNPTIPPPPSASNDVQEPFDPFGRNVSSTETKKEQDNKSSIDYMRNLFASNSNNLFTKPADQAKTETTTIPEQNQQPISTVTESTTADQKSDVTAATENAQQNTSPAFDPFGVGSSVPMMEGASFTFNIDEQEETTKANEDQNAHKLETSANEKSSSTTAPSNNNDSPIFTFDIPQQQQPQQQQQTQQPQIVDDLFFDFSSIPPPKSDNINTKAIDDFNITAPSQPAASPEVDENIRPGTDESSMSLSDDDEGENVKQLPANSEQKQSNQSETKKEASQISLNESKSGSGIGFYSDGVNSFTFDADKERLSGPNPFEIGKQNQDANPFVTNSEQSKASTVAASTTESAQKFNPFAIPPPPSLSTSKNAPSTDVFKIAEAEKKEESAAKTSTSDESFNPFGQQPQKPKTVQEQPDPFAKPQQSTATEKPKEEQSNNSVFSPFGQPPQKPKTQDIPDPFVPPPVSSSPSNEKPKEEASSNNNASFNPFGQQPQKPKTVQEQPDPFATPQQSAAAEKPKEEQSNNSVFSPFGQPPQKPKTQDIPDPFAQPSSSNESQAADQSNDVPFNPFGQVFPTKENESNAESSFTFKLRSNQTPEIDENDFLPVGQQETQTKSEEEPSSSQKTEAQQQQSFSPFGTVNQNQNQQPLGFGAMNTAQQQSNQNQPVNGEENNNAVTKPRKSDDSSQNLSFVKRARTSSASDPFTLLINSLTPYTEIVESESDDDDEVNANGQIQSHHHHHHNHEEDSDENESENPFTHWKPTELDSALGKCDEPEELNEETLNKFRGKIPPPPTFVAFEQSPAANILKEYCSQLSNTGSSLEHINELLGIQDMARISIEEFSA